ncbi:molybdopterin-dependent oxidoreductase [Kitasatospora cineracea]|uniref:molybdopterin-dependent oxidoreductase n=1 Tax=Kitasatospora cineracea TaxID=88074 RepID=UPI0036DE8CED
MSLSPGFSGRGGFDTSRLPPGQFLTEDFPVLSAGPTPEVPLDQWEFTLTTEDGEQRRWNWQEFLALPQQDVTTDLHCVTRWSKFDTRWRGVSLDTLLDGVATRARFALAECHGGYTTNLSLDDLRGGRVWIAHTYNGGSAGRPPMRPGCGRRRATDEGHPPPDPAGRLQALHLPTVRTGLPQCRPALPRSARPGLPG